MIKAERKLLRRKITADVTPMFMRRMGLRWTTGQIHAAVKQFVDKQMSEMRKAQANMAARPIEPFESPSECPTNPNS